MLWKDKQLKEDIEERSSGDGCELDLTGEYSTKSFLIMGVVAGLAVRR